MLHLAAADEDDLAIISAQMQDALARRDELRFDSKRRRFAMATNRFAWDAMPEKLRRRAVLRFEDVEQVQAQGLAQLDAGSVLSLLSISFTHASDLSGVITLAFSANVTLRLWVSCINAALDDLGGTWGVVSVPAHDDGALG